MIQRDGRRNTTTQHLQKGTKTEKERERSEETTEERKVTLRWRERSVTVR